MNNNNPFGYTFRTDKQFNLETADASFFRRLTLLEPSILRCIFCGGCSATCTAAQFADLKFRVISICLRRGQLKQIKHMITYCMLCGKCTMVCPQNVNIRNVMFILKKEL